jgi:ElaA protein
MYWKTKAFQELSLEELYQIMVLRQAVFVVEQDCPYLDADGNDQVSFHLLGYDEAEELVAYARLLPKGVSYDDAVAIGRVVNSSKVRGKGIGKELMEISITETKRLFKNEKITLSAQCYLQKFYEELGFQTVGESYLEDDIPHIKMDFLGKA